MSTLKVNELQNTSGGNSITNVGKIVQVVQTVKTAAFSQSSLGSGVFSNDVITCTITPSSSSNKILVTSSLVAGSDLTEPTLAAIVVRDSTITDYRGPADGSKIRLAAGAAAPHSTNLVNLCLEYLDSPSTASAVTYRIRICGLFGQTSHTAYVNRGSDDSDNDYTPKPASTLILMEVSA